jgi:hypothetical protein
MSYSFHKYWNDPTLGTIQYLISMGNTYNVPLWMGESGENSNHWFYEAVHLFESNSIGWNWWTHKKLEKITSPLSAIISSQYQDILDYWNGNGSEPSQVYAQAALFGMAENLKIENCETRPGVIPSLLDPNFGETPVPLKSHSIPGMIAAVDYDIGANNVAYTDNDYMNTGEGGYNWGWVHRNDGVDIEVNADQDGLPFNVGWTDVGEWMGYTIEDVTAGTYDVTVSVSAMSAGGIFFLQLSGQNLGVLNVPSTGGWHNWQDMVIPNVVVTEGEKFLRVQTVQAGYNIERITFESVTSSIDDLIILDQFMLGEPYPNPFNPSVMMDLTNHEPSEYTISIVNLKGEKVYHKSLGVLEPGKHSLNWDGVNFNGKSVTSGVYLLIISDGKMSLRKKLVLMR